MKSVFRSIAKLSDRELVRIVADAQQRTDNVLGYSPREKRALRELSRRVWRAQTIA